MPVVTPTAYEHVSLDPQGRPWIEAANTKVVELVEKVQAHGYSPEELAYQLPHLTLGQIHSALAYYWDHQEEMDREVERRDEQVERSRREAGEHPLITKLKARGQI